MEFERDAASSHTPLTTRRTLLVGAAATAAMAALPAAPAIARNRLRDARALSFVNLHTGEKANVTYHANGTYVPDALSRLDDLFRDPRNNHSRPIDRRVYEWLFALRDQFDTSEPFMLISGYRSPETNEWLRRQGRGVAKKSYHLKGRAADVRLPGVDIVQLGRAAKSMRRGGVGLYRRSQFVHVDSGPPRSWGI